MKTLKKIEVVPIFIDVIPDKLDENTLYISLKYHVAIHLCLCGCGNQAVTPFSLKSNGWNLIEKDGKVSFTPSILNTNCPNRYHYIITNNIANVC